MDRRLRCLARGRDCAIYSKLPLRNETDLITVLTTVKIR
jgi:hypothetical protein